MGFYEHPNVLAFVDSALLEFQSLDHAADPEWTVRVKAATAPNASVYEKLFAVTAFFDLDPTKTGNLRVPCSFNIKGYYGFPLPQPTEEWPATLRRPATPANAALTEAEFAILECISRPSDEEPKVICENLNLLFSRKREREDGSELTGVDGDGGSEVYECDVTYIPRFSSDTRVRLPEEGSAERIALIPPPVRAMVSLKCIKALERGIELGGVPPWRWKPEPEGGLRSKICKLGGGLGNDVRFPTVLLVLTGLEIDYEECHYVARSMVMSHFPVNCLAEALDAQRTRIKFIDRYRQWFRTFAADRHRPVSMGFNFTRGCYERVRFLAPNVKAMCSAGANCLGGTGSSGVGSTASSKVTAREFTGRTVSLELTRPKDVVLDEARPALELRNNDALERAEKSLNRIYNNSVDGILTLNEYIATDARFGYVVNGYAGWKSIYRELRPSLMRGYYSVDIRRAHLSILVGCYHRAVANGSMKRYEDLEWIVDHFDELEMQLKADQVQLLPGAELRLANASTDTERKYATNFVKYLQVPTKQLLSVAINHPDNSRMFKTWPSMIRLQKAISVAARAAFGHEFVRVDTNRPNGFSKRGEKSRICTILERRAVHNMMETLSGLGLAIGPSLNDEIYVKPVAEPTESELVKWEKEVTESLKTRMGFSLRVRFQKY